MDITHSGTGDSRTLTLAGRLDSRWAGHLTESVATALREGAHHIQLDLAQVSFISSAGLRALLQAHKRIAAARGLLRLRNPSPEARTILELSGLEALLAPLPDLPQPGAQPTFDSPTAHWTQLHSATNAHFTGQLWGQPGLPLPPPLSTTVWAMCPSTW
ncbi:MAG: STAS domain-containing protein, partial [Verrucomicrobiia bacterium]